MADSAIDNDVLFKSVCYGFFSELVASAPGEPPSPGVLGTARFVVPKLMRKRPPQRVNASEDLATVMQALEVLEPTPAEVSLAADLQLAAQQQALALHVGECQLVAILYSRNLRFLLTGDRAAIEGIARLAAPAQIDVTVLRGKLICFEQAIRLLVATRGAGWVRAAICAEREVDTALRICFSCSSPEVGEDSWLEGLENHIQSLRQVAGELLLVDAREVT